MNIFFKQKKFLFIYFILLSLFAIFFALYVEYILGYKPCKLCLIKEYLI